MINIDKLSVVSLYIPLYLAHVEEYLYLTPFRVANITSSQHQIGSKSINF